MIRQRAKGRGQRAEGIVASGQWSAILFIVHCSLFIVFTGCASTKSVEMPKSQKEAIELNQMGIDAVNVENYAKALIDLQKSFKLNNSIDNQKGMAVNLLNFGRLYLIMERFDDAKTSIERAITIGFNTDDQFILSEGYASIGRYYYLTGSSEEAIDILEKAVAIDRKNGYPAIGNKLNIMGMVYKDSNRLEEARTILNEALKANRRYGMELDVADSFRGLGDISFKKRDYKMASDLYENALSIDRKNGNIAKISIDLSLLGLSSLEGNDTKKALDFFLRAYTTDLSSSDNKKALKNIDNIIELYNKLEDKNNAQIYLMEKEKILQR